LTWRASQRKVKGEKKIFAKQKMKKVKYGAMPILTFDAQQVKAG
jgi:hypothetical protein